MNNIPEGYVQAYTSRGFPYLRKDENYIPKLDNIKNITETGRIILKPKDLITDSKYNIIGNTKSGRPILAPKSQSNYKIIGFTENKRPIVRYY